MDPIAYFQSHPPRCVADFNCQVVGMPEFPDDVRNHCDPGFEFEDHPVGPGTAFRLLCSCGSNLYFIHGYHYTNTEGKEPVELFISPHSLECAACKKRTDLLDMALHGWDAENGHGCYSFRACGTPAVFRCRSCGEKSMETLITFSYCHAERHLDDPDDPMNGREEDFFDWVVIGGTCANCSKLQRVTEYECS